MSVARAVIAFPQAADSLPENIHPLTRLPYVSDGEHLLRALESEDPIAYIEARTGRFEYEGEMGLGGINASILLKILVTKNIEPYRGWLAADQNLCDKLAAYKPCPIQAQKIMKPKGNEIRLGHMGC